MISMTEKGPKHVQVHSIGAGRGASRALSWLAGMNTASSQMQFRDVLVDPVPEKAVAVAQKGQELGLSTDAQLERGEIFVHFAHKPDSVNVAAIDDPRAVSRILEASDGLSMLVYNILELPELGMAAVRAAITPDDLESRVVAALFFARIADVTAPSGSEDVLGANSPTRNRLMEDRFREQWFAPHFEANSLKLVHGLEPESAPLEITFDGRRTSQLEVIDSQDSWRTESQLIAEVQSLVRWPIRRGAEFAVAELGPDEAMAIHRLNYRVTDGRWMVSERPRLRNPNMVRAEQQPRPASLLTKFSAALVTD